MKIDHERKGVYIIQISVRSFAKIFTVICSLIEL